MKSRLNQLPDNQLVQQITAMQQDLDQLKTAQLAGSSDVQLTRVVTGSPIDFTATIASGAQTIWEVTFTPNDTTFANTGWVWHIFFDIVSQSGTVSYDDAVEQLLPTGTQQSWRIYFAGVSSGTPAVLNLLVVVYAIGNGTLSFTQIL
jgi:hypothetical protein